MNSQTLLVSFKTRGWVGCQTLAYLNAANPYLHLPSAVPPAEDDKRSKVFTQKQNFTTTTMHIVPLA